MIEHTTGGKESLAGLADDHQAQPSAILRLTASTVQVMPFRPTSPPTSTASSGTIAATSTCPPAASLLAVAPHLSMP